jgi:hypothetical protein
MASIALPKMIPIPIPGPMAARPKTRPFPIGETSMVSVACARIVATAARTSISSPF